MAACWADEADDLNGVPPESSNWSSTGGPPMPDSVGVALGNRIRFRRNDWSS